MASQESEKRVTNALLAGSASGTGTASSMYEQAREIFGVHLDDQSEIEVYKIWYGTPEISKDGFLSPGSPFAPAYKVEQTSYTAKSGEEIAAAGTDHWNEMYGADVTALAAGYLAGGEEGAVAALTEISPAHSDLESYGQSMATPWTRDQLLNALEEISQFEAQRAVITNPSLSDGTPYGDSPHLTDIYEEAEAFLYAEENGYKDEQFSCIMEYGTVTNWKDVGYDSMTGYIAEVLGGPDHTATGFGGLVSDDAYMGSLTGGGAMMTPDANIAGTDRTVFILEPRAGITPALNVAYSFPQLVLTETEDNPIMHGPDSDLAGQIILREEIDGLPSCRYGEAVILKYSEPGYGSRLGDSMTERWKSREKSLEDCQSYIKENTKKVSATMATVMNHQFMQKRQKSTAVTNANLSALVSGTQTTATAAQATTGVDLIATIASDLPEFSEPSY